MLLPVYKAYQDLAAILDFGRFCCDALPSASNLLATRRSKIGLVNAVALVVAQVHA